VASGLRLRKRCTFVCVSASGLLTVQFIGVSVAVSPVKAPPSRKSRWTEEPDVEDTRPSVTSSAPPAPSMPTSVHSSAPTRASPAASAARASPHALGSFTTPNTGVTTLAPSTSAAQNPGAQGRQRVYKSKAAVVRENELGKLRSSLNLKTSR
jgi:hypothetical protein